MNTKRELYLGLLFSFLGIGNALQAYTIKIKNLKTYETKGMSNLISPKSKIQFWVIREAVFVYYFGWCQQDKRSLDTNETITINAKACITKAVTIYGRFYYEERSPQGVIIKGRDVKATIEPKLGKRRGGNFKLKLKNPSASFENLKLQIIQTD